MRIMGLDVGTKRIGLAVSDETGSIAQGRETVARTSDEKAVAAIKEIASAEKVAEIVVGLPLNMDGSEGPSAEGCRKFAKKLSETLKVPVKFWDERLSTKEAESVMLMADVSRAGRKKAVDKLAAVVILQRYLDSLNAHSS